MRSEAFILRKTIHGNRLHPITIAQAEELVSKMEAKKLKAGFYDGTTAVPQGSPEQETRKLTTSGKGRPRRPSVDE